MAKKKRSKKPSRKECTEALAKTLDYAALREGTRAKHQREGQTAQGVDAKTFYGYLKCRGKTPFHLPLAKCKSDTRRLGDIVCDEACEWADWKCMADEIDMNEDDLKRQIEDVKVNGNSVFDVRGSYFRLDAGDLCTTQLSGMWVTIIMALLLLLLGVVLFIAWKRSLPPPPA